MVVLEVLVAVAVVVISGNHQGNIGGGDSGFYGPGGSEEKQSRRYYER